MVRLIIQKIDVRNAANWQSISKRRVVIMSLVFNGEKLIGRPS